MDADIRRLIQAAHVGGHKCVVCLTGGGASAAAYFLSVPGASRTVLEICIPYNDQALIEYLGGRPEQFCSPYTAKEMARRAYERARWLAPGQPVIGLGCTASLATDRPKLGDHRCYVATQSVSEVRCYSLTLQKGGRDREAEESVVAAMVLNALATTVGIEQQLAFSLFSDEKVQVEVDRVGDAIHELVEATRPLLYVEPDGLLQADAPPVRLVVAGAFNPLHEGHCELGLAASRLTGHSPVFELSVVNVDKAPLAVEEVRCRVTQFQWRFPVCLTRAPTFTEKANLLPGAIFVVGVDTAMRILSPDYYVDAGAGMLHGLERIRGQGCRFFVAGRAHQEQRFLKLGHLTVPHGFEDLFTEIPEDLFRRDISSTQLRSATGSKQSS
jgi:hypothetical protein